MNMRENELELNELETVAGGSVADDVWNYIKENPVVKKVTETAEDVSNKISTTVDKVETLGKMVWDRPGLVIDIIKNA